MTIFICHGIIDARTADRAARLAPVEPSSRLVVIPADGLAAIASACPDVLQRGQSIAEILATPEGVAEFAVAHNRIVTEFAATEDVVPLRLDSFHSDAGAVADMLRRDGARLRRSLERIAGCCEIAATFDRRPSGVSPAETAAALSGRDYLRRQGRDRQRLAQLRADLAGTVDLIEQHLRRIARGVLRLPTGDAGPTGRTLARLALLMPRTRLGELEHDLPELVAGAHAAGLDVTVSGPWAPYYFTADAEAALEPAC